MTLRAELEPTPAGPVAPDPAAAAEAGALFRAARERCGLGIAECAARLAIPAPVLRRLEDGKLGALDSGVFLRGHLRSYGRLLGIDPATVEAWVRTLAPEVQPLLRASGRLPSAHYAIERYLRAGSYIAITVAIAAPLAWFAMHGDAGGDRSRLQAINSSPVAVSTLRGPPARGPAGVPQVPADAAGKGLAAARQPLLATMTPFLGGDAATPDESVPARASSTDHVLAMRLSAPSWVEVTNGRGQHLEYALLQPGQYHWVSDSPLQVLVGNASAVNVTVNGRHFPIENVSASNVARFSVGTASGNG